MKFPSQITVVAALAILAGYTASAYAFFAPVSNLPMLNEQSVAQIALRTDAQPSIPMSVASLIPSATPISPDFGDRAQKLFDRSA